jgi:RNA polymerase sigma factor (sigma-70 family)
VQTGTPGAEPLDALAARARTGDEGAFAALAAAVRDRVRRWALVRTGDPDDAEDVAQTVVIRVHRGLARFEGRSRFATWLYRLTANAAAEMQRGHARRTRLHGAAAADDLHASPALEDRIGEMENARAAALVRRFRAASARSSTWWTCRATLPRRRRRCWRSTRRPRACTCSAPAAPSASASWPRTPA